MSRDEPVYRKLAPLILGGLAEGKYQEEIAAETHYTRARITQCVGQLRQEYGARTVTQLVVMYDREQRT